MTPPIVKWLILGGAIAIVVGGVLGATVTPFAFLIAAAGLIDFALAFLFASGRMGSAYGEFEAQGAAPLDAEPTAERTGTSPDPTYNPYARED